MVIVIITHVPHKIFHREIFAYAPYVREMNLWFKYVNKVVLIAPKVETKPTPIEIPYKHDNILFHTINSVEFTSFKSSVISVIKIPSIIWTIFKTCKKADHIHLRCPGNIGLFGCFVQVFFPKKPKTAKYAGNWDPNGKQPFSYKLQKWILSNTFLTKNSQVLVYGDWNNQTKNIKPFFTATYSNSEIEPAEIRDYSNEIKFVFVGSLVQGKRPLFTIRIVEALKKQGKKVSLDIYGDGVLKNSLNQYVSKNKLDGFIKLHGNKEISVVKTVLKTAHFLILPSKSEGWPKAVAEAMFYGTIPVTTSVSCIPFMLNFGERGIIINPDVQSALESINKVINDSKSLKRMSKLAATWSQQYTLEVFDEEISKLLNRSY
ncbi:MAG: glycosyltransferase family 4 protein [Flaviramulus sp.]|nr:glycosyltransferase [Flaviramulus sp.]NNC50924.1 glycosyltransferase family 4 protein [Flaviramulus sp.]